VSDFEIRPVTRDDAEAVNDLLAAAEAIDHTEEHYTVAEVVEELENPMIDIARDWLVVERDGQVVAQCRLTPRSPDAGALSLAVDGTVHPDHRRQGIGSQLVPRMVARAKEYVHERGADLRPVVTGYARDDIAGRGKLLESAGLRPDRWSFVMSADLRAPRTLEQPLLPDGYSWSTWQGVADDELREAHNEAFTGNPGYTPWSPEMWRQWVSGSSNFRPALSLVARDEDGAVAAYIQTAEFDGVLEATGTREAYVSKVGTLPGHRRKGLAGTLLRLALQRYRDAGFDRAALDVDSENPTGALGVYERAGFRTTQKWTNYRLEGSSSTAPD